MTRQWEEGERASNAPGSTKVVLQKSRGTRKILKDASGSRLSEIHGASTRFFSSISLKHHEVQRQDSFVTVAYAIMLL